MFQKENGPVLDIGAGTGLFSMELAKYTEDLDIIALEPSKEMRIEFMAKLMQQGTLSSRITVVPESVMEYELPDTLSGVVCMGVIGHLNQGQREKLWRRLEKSLKKGTPVIIETLDKSLLKAEEGTRISAKSVGKYRYETYIKDKKNAGGKLVRVERNQSLNDFFYQIAQEGPQKQTYKMPSDLGIGKVVQVKTKKGCYCIGVGHGLPRRRLCTGK